jgi:hypothetical protein
MANPIEDDPELARAVGLLAGRWGLVEFYVEFIFALLVGTDDRKAAILFSFFKGVGTQCDIIRHLLDETPEVSDDARARIITILKKYRELAPERNAILHYPFGWDSEGGERTIYKSATQRKGPELRLKKPTSAAAIIAVADRVDQLTDEIVHLMAVDFWKPTPLQGLLSPSQDQTQETSTGLLGFRQSPNEEQ